MKCDKRKKGKKHAEFKLFVDQNNKDYKRVDKDNQGITYDDRKIMRPITEKKIEALEEAKKKFEQSKKKSKKEKKNDILPTT